MKKTFVYIFLVVVAFFVGSIILSCKRQPALSTVGREPVTIGAASEILSAPIIIAQEKGYFAEEGLDVTMREYNYGKLAFNDLFKGRVDLATVADTPIVMTSFKRADYAVVAGFVHNYNEEKIVTRTDRGIHTASDLAGKKIGTTYGTSAHFFLDVYLTYNRIKKSDVTVINIPQNDLPDALQRGEVDAISAFEPYAYLALKRLPDKTMTMPKQELLRRTFNLVSMKDFAKSHPETLKKVLRAVDRAVDYISQNREGTMAVLAKKLGVDETYLHAKWNDYVFGLVLDQSMLLTFEDIAQWAIDNNLTDKKQVPDYLGFIYFDAMESIKPEEVRILR